MEKVEKLIIYRYNKEVVNTLSLIDGIEAENLWYPLPHIEVKFKIHKVSEESFLDMIPQYRTKEIGTNGVSGIFHEVMGRMSGKNTEDCILLDEIYRYELHLLDSVKDGLIRNFYLNQLLGVKRL